MAYIIKNTSGLLNTRLTDIGRQRLSEGNFNIKYFQIGDSEITYTAIPNYNLTNNFILEAAYNAQNGSQQPQTNKMNIKYPFYVKGSSGNTYGLATQDSQISPVYNTAAPRGFFTGNPYSWSAQTSSAYTVTSNYVIDVCTLCPNNQVPIISSGTCSPTTGTPQIGDFVTIFFDGVGDCGNISGDYPILTYQIQNIIGSVIEVDRDLPDFTGNSCCGTARILVYPSGMTQLYDTTTPMGYWPPSVINFESICDLGNTDVKIWNMNIPWSVSPAGLNPFFYEDYKKFGSAAYLGSKEYFGYQNTSGQTFFVSPTLSAETTDSYYYNSYDEIIPVQPYEQKAIAIVHYTNNAVDSFYGEKFALEPYDINAIDTTGFARNFKVTIPWLMWHKSNTGLMGETFYVDPTGFTNSYFDVKYMQSSKNGDMNEPGLRYYHLWDTHLNSDGNPSRVGKVFPDLKTIVFDDEEIIAAMSYKANRNWTLPAPKLSLMTPSACDSIFDDNGLLGNENEYLYVTYRFTSTAFTESLHCNYYTKIRGPFVDCTSQRQDVAIKFGDEFPFLKNCCFQGFGANGLQILVQVVTGSTTQPDPSSWIELDYTNQLSATTVNGLITSSGLTNNTFIVSYNQYYTATTKYYLGNYINLPDPTNINNEMNFGDEYYFYGNIETDIQATIYEMKFLCNLASTQFTNTSNPTWKTGTSPYVTEVGLFSDDKDLMVITKLQSPILRQGSQQYTIKIDF
jgi:hypothetical protein